MRKFNNYIALLGPTSSGKSKLAIDIAKKTGGEILNIDSVTLYKHLSIGTAKPSYEERKVVKHYLLDTLEPDEKITVVEFVQMAEEVIKQMTNDNIKPIFVAGSPLYFYSLTKDTFQPPPTDSVIRKNLLERTDTEELIVLYSELKEKDPYYATKINQQDKKRIIRALEVIQLTGKPFSSFGKSILYGKERYNLLKIGLNPERIYLKERIYNRTIKMIEAGLIEEVRYLMKSGISSESPCFEAIGYREALALIKNEISLEELVTLINKRTFAYAKHQMTWFKRDLNINWFSYKNENEFNLISKEILRLC